MNDKYEQLKSVIEAANPEIMEWRCEGCNRKYGEYINGCVFCWRDDLSREENISLFPDRSVRRVPREIRLADVLLVILEIRPYSYFVTVNGDFWEWRHHSEEPQRIGVSWNLKDDNLDHQSDECKQFLIELLTSNK